ncbi:MAG: helix-turn-helix domain-containing protein [Endozoicomonas sp.]
MIFNDSDNYPAPACARGLWVLHCLSLSEQPMTLEQLYQKADIPKATLSRILETLTQMEVVHRHQNRTYEANVRFMKKDEAATSFQQRLRVEMIGLSKRRGYTVEWYEPSIKGMVLQHSISPIVERRVWAKEGYIRSWQGEIEAVYRVGRAYTPEHYPVNETPWVYGDRGRRESVRWDEVLEEIHQLPATGGYADVYFNENGVRRSAVAIHNQGTFKGVLATAECWTPSIDMRVNDELLHLMTIRHLFS